ncbi:MAG: hypothetical protein Kow0077_09890 [Anaerolineae bacterium]
MSDSRFHFLLAVFIGIGIIAAGGCSPVENVAGVVLATANPTATSDAISTSVPLTRTLEKDFVGTVISINYPETWQTSESGQSISAFDPGTADSGGPGIGLFVALTRTVGVDAGEEGIAPVIMSRFLARGAEFGAVPREAVPDEAAAYPFTWGGHDAALYRWTSSENDTVGVQLLVLDGAKRRFVIIGAQASKAYWTDFEPTLHNILATFTLDGETLPIDDVIAALNAFPTP